jgi:hypothetical protein
VLAAQSVTVQAQLEEAIVTAQLRTESLQDVPISMVAMSGDTINELAVFANPPFTEDAAAISALNRLLVATATGGNDTMHSPDWAFNLRFDYSVPVFESMEARAVLNVNYSDDFFTGGKLDPVITHQDDYTT